MCHTKIYNVMTLQVIEMLSKMLNFGLFSPDSKLATQKEYDHAIAEVTKLVQYLSRILEYDESYVDACKGAQIFRSTPSPP